MSKVVVDASAMLSILVPSQSTPSSVAFHGATPSLRLCAPPVFAFEVRHALLKLERRGLVGPQALDSDFPSLETTIDVDAPAPSSDLIALARAANLGVYDAAYLHLALTRTAALASRDAQLLVAAQARGVAVHDLR